MVSLWRAEKKKSSLPQGGGGGGGGGGLHPENNREIAACL